jgi:hypothetical protein
VQFDRREFLKAACAAGLGGLFQARPLFAASLGQRRCFHACLSTEAIQRDPDLLSTLRAAGIEAVWLAGFFYGHWPYPLEKLREVRAQLARAGLAAHVVNVPLGHPGDSLGSHDGSFPLTPPRHWRLAQRVDGSQNAGTSLHEPATSENVAALRRLRRAGFTRFFLDDDFRLARGPGQIGGCFCGEHRARFLERGGYPAGRWEELLADARARRLTPLLRAWIEFNCDALTASFRAQRRAVGRGELGVMVMYLGAEKAGLRLKDYAAAPFRVGELMFDDASFSPVKGKTDELFSVLMHRRFARPELAYSETTAFPANQLSARNMAAKLAVSTIADVRHTMFMSGVTPFPRAHWEVLAPAMKAQAAAHARLAGHRLRGPFKHYWGERSRWVGDDRPFSLFLAAGVPFAVAEEPGRVGWVFLSDFDARALAEGDLAGRGARFVHRPSVRLGAAEAEPVEESLTALWAFKRRLGPSLGDVPHVLEETPVVCAWYPSARAVLLWNLDDRSRTLTLQRGQRRQQIALDSLEARVFADLGSSEI